jgi:hypothetical protein
LAAKPPDRPTGWLDRGDRRAILWSVFGVLGFILLPVVIFAVVLLGAWLGIWHLAFDH